MAGGHAWWGGVCGRGCAWQEAFMTGGVHGRGHAWQRGWGHAWQGGMCDGGIQSVGQCAGGTHPTGMHSCTENCFPY